MQQAMRIYSFIFFDSIFVVVAAMGTVGLVANMEFFVYAQGYIPQGVWPLDSGPDQGSWRALPQKIKWYSWKILLWRMRLPLASVRWRP